MLSGDLEKIKDVYFDNFFPQLFFLITSTFPFAIYYPCESFPDQQNSHIFSFDIGVLTRLCSAVWDLKGSHLGQIKAWSSVYAHISGRSYTMVLMASVMFDILWIFKHKQSLLKVLDD
jgi:hypothetical protein